VRAARGRASHLPHHGFLLRTWEPQSERRASDARQAAKPSDVSDEGRSLRSSRSAGEPRTWRREAVGAYGFAVAGESHVCGISARSELAPERAAKTVHAKRGKPRLRISQTVGTYYRSSQSASGRRACCPQ